MPLRVTAARHPVQERANRSSPGLRQVVWSQWKLVGKRSASYRTEATVKVPYGGDDQPLKAYRVGLRAYAEKRHHPDDPRVAITRVLFYPDLYLSALPDNYYVVFHVESMRSDGRWKRVKFQPPLDTLPGGKNVVGRITWLQDRTTHSDATITHVRLRHRLVHSDYKGTVPLLQINSELKSRMRRVPKSFVNRPR